MAKKRCAQNWVWKIITFLFFQILSINATVLNPSLLAHLENYESVCYASTAILQHIQTEKD